MSLPAFYRNKKNFQPSFQKAPCPVCGQPGNCTQTADKKGVYCWRVGAFHLSVDGGATWAKFDQGQKSQRDKASHSNRLPTYSAQPDTTEAPRLTNRKADLLDKRDRAKADKPQQAHALATFASKLNIPLLGMERLGAWVTGLILYWAEKKLGPDGQWEPIAAGTRNFITDAKKGVYQVGRGVGSWIAPGANQVHVVEGGTDGAVLAGVGLSTVTRPSNTQGSREIIELLRHVDAAPLVWSENDRKTDGSHPGREGAEKISQELANGLMRPVHLATPPKARKDFRAWWRAYCGEYPRVDTVRPTSGGASMFAVEVLNRAVETGEIVHPDKSHRDEYLHKRACAHDATAVETLRRCTCGAPRQGKRRYRDGRVFWAVLQPRCGCSSSCDNCNIISQQMFCVRANLAWKRAGTIDLYRYEVGEDDAPAKLREIRDANGSYCWMRVEGGQRIIIADVVVDGMLDSTQSYSDGADEWLCDASRTIREKGIRRFEFSQGWQVEAKPGQTLREAEGEDGEGGTADGYDWEDSGVTSWKAIHAVAELRGVAIADEDLDGQHPTLVKCAVAPALNDDAKADEFIEAIEIHMARDRIDLDLKMALLVKLSYSRSKKDIYQVDGARQQELHFADDSPPDDDDY